MTVELLTAEQVAEQLQITVDQVKRRTTADNWPCVRLSSKTIRYRPEHVEFIIALYDQAGKVAPVKGLAGQTAASRRRSA